MVQYYIRPMASGTKSIGPMRQRQVIIRYMCFLCVRCIYSFS